MALLRTTLTPHRPPLVTVLTRQSGGITRLSLVRAAPIGVTVLGQRGPAGPAGQPGPAGAAGAPGVSGAISADADNRATHGADGGLYVPELAVDPLAYYILARS